NAYNLSINNASNFTDQNFGQGKNNRFYGFVYQDLDADGGQDAFEVGVPGRKIFQDTNKNGIWDEGNIFHTSKSPELKSNANASFKAALVVSGLAPNTVVDVNVKLNITHTWDGDLSATLYTAGQTKIPLFTNLGGPNNSGDNLVNTVFDDSAVTPIGSG